MKITVESCFLQIVKGSFVNSQIDFSQFFYELIHFKLPRCQKLYLNFISITIHQGNKNIFVLKSYSQQINKEIMITIPKNEYYTINIANLKLFLQKFVRKQPQKSTMRDLIKNLSIGMMDVASLQQILNLAFEVEEMYRNLQRKQKHLDCWAIGQQRLFCFILPYFCVCQGLKHSQLNASVLRPLQSIFVSKTSIELCFQIRYLNSLTNNIKTPWNQKDSQILAEIVVQNIQQEEVIKKWKKISYSLFIRNGGTNFHPPKDCKQKWTNHLDPKLSKDSWSLREDLELFTFIKEYGCKWSQISKKMKKLRSEHTVKNRVNYFIRKYRFKTKNLTNNQIDKIVAVLQKEIASQENGKQKQQQIMTERMSERQEQSLALQQFEVERKMMVGGRISDNWINLFTDRVTVTSHQLKQSWSQGLDKQMIDMQMERSQYQKSSSIFDQLLMPHLPTFFSND